MGLQAGALIERVCQDVQALVYPELRETFSGSSLQCCKPAIDSTAVCRRATPSAADCGADAADRRHFALAAREAASSLWVGQSRARTAISVPPVGADRRTVTLAGVVEIFSPDGGGSFVFARTATSIPL